MVKSKDERVKVDYATIHKIEAKYGSLTDCPENDEDLMKLRVNMGADKVGEVYNKEEVEFLRKQYGYTPEEVGVMIGYTTKWYAKFRKNGSFSSVHVSKLSELFGVEPDYFIS